MKSHDLTVRYINYEQGIETEKAVNSIKYVVFYL